MYRLIGKPDLVTLYNALTTLAAFARVYEWADIDVATAFDNVDATIAKGNAYYVGGYLVLVDEVTPWYSKDKVLQEWLVLRLDRTGGLAEVPRALLAIAKERGCKTVITGDSSPVNIVANAYREAGFNNLTQSFFKRIP